MTSQYLGYPNEFAAEPMPTQQMVDLCKEHTLYTWAAGNTVNPLPIARAEGIYLYTPEGQKIIDFNAQLMSVLVGHAHPRVIAAMKRQIDELIFVYPQTATQVRARLGKLLSEIIPGMSAFFFTLACCFNPAGNAATSCSPAAPSKSARFPVASTAANCARAPPCVDGTHSTVPRAPSVYVLRSPVGPGNTAVAPASTYDR